MNGGTCCIGIVGAGTMGRGIMQLLAQAGHEVCCFDATPGAVDAALGHIRQVLERQVAKGTRSPAQVTSVTNRLRHCQSLQELAGCEVVIEAIVEDLPAKRALFQALEAVIAPDAILATNTSSLLVSALAAACTHAGRVAGLHFFNPVPLMKVAEVIPGIRTSPHTVAALVSIVTAAGHRAVVAADQPGFLVNHAGRGLYTEGLRILEESVADPEDIDRVLTGSLGFRMGPFELLDLTGLDVSGKVMQSIYDQFQQEPRFKPSPLVPPRIAAGVLGRKSGEGWYAYATPRPAESTRRAPPALPGSRRVWVHPLADDRLALRQLIDRSSASAAESAEDADLLLVQCWGIDATEYSRLHGLDARRVVAIDPLPGFARHRTLMLTVATQSDARDTALALCCGDGTAATVINDSCGFIAQRVLATIVNIACDIAQRGIASVSDLEAAVTLGLGYPQGPLSWGDQIGPARILQILTGLQAATGDPRYRPSPWLRRRAALGVSLLQGEPSRRTA